MTNKKTDKPQVEELSDTDLEKASGGYYTYELKNLKGDPKSTGDKRWKVEEGDNWKVEEGESVRGGKVETSWKVEEGES